MNLSIEGYFSSGELANLIGISRQILRYYEKEGILTPDFIDDNGYRYYKPESYFTLEIVISLRKLEIPLDNIKEFLQNRSLASLQNFFMKQIDLLDDKKRNLERCQKIFNEKLSSIDKLKNMPINNIILVPKPPQKVYLSTAVPLNLPRKDQLKLFAEFLRPYIKGEQYIGFTIGYMEYYDVFCGAGHCNQFHSLIITDTPVPRDANCFLKCEGGLYLSTTFKNALPSVPQEVRDYVNEYIKLNNLKVLSNVFVYTLGDYWSSQKEEDVLSCLYIQVEYKK
ncbi:MAG: MerR family transcriptional regulator [Phascolarctobacterium sp.]|nr:MerR family transcriptional regulator [Phascolarctobacterium sp.]